MADKTEIKPLTPADYNGDIKTLEALIAKYEPHFAQGAHLITATGALRTVVTNLTNHNAALASKAKEAKSA